MRILIATINRNLVGGVEKYLHGLIPSLQERGHEVVLLHENRPDPRLMNVDPAARPIQTWCVAEIGLAAALQSASQWKPGIVYSHGLESASLEGALLEAYPTVLYAHNYYGTCPTGRKCHAFPNARPCDRTIGPACLLLHYPRRCGGWNPATMWSMYQRQSQLNSRLMKFQNILVASHHMYREFRQNGVSAEKLELIPLPATDSAPLLDPPVPKRPDGRLLFVGRLTDLKGVHYLIEAVPQAAEILGRNLRLVIAGDGPERQRLQELAQRLGIAPDFRGWVSTSQKVELMRQADLLVVPSLWPEPFALVGIEAGCLGLPAAGYAVGGIPDWLHPGQTGEHASGDPPTVRGLAEAIAKALGDPDRYMDLCRGAWENSKRFTLREHLARLEPVLAGPSSNRPLPAQTLSALRTPACLPVSEMCGGDPNVS
jgi:glycosyltransferase involved in cell wall biosynthesis